MLLHSLPFPMGVLEFVHSTIHSLNRVPVYSFTGIFIECHLRVTPLLTCFPSLCLSLCRTFSGRSAASSQPPLSGVPRGSSHSEVAVFTHPCPRGNSTDPKHISSCFPSACWTESCFSTSPSCPQNGDSQPLGAWYTVIHLGGKKENQTKM